MATVANVATPAPPACNRCRKTHSSPLALLLICSECTTPWHHSCHIPPLSDQQLHARMRATLDDVVLNSLSDWLCRRCVKKRNNATSVHNPAGTSAVQAPRSTGSTAIGDTSVPHSRLVTQPVIPDPQTAISHAAAEPGKITQGTSPSSAFQPYVSPLNYTFLRTQGVNSPSPTSNLPRQAASKIAPIQHPSLQPPSNSVVSDKSGGTAQSSVSPPSARHGISADDSEGDLPAPRFPYEHSDMSYPPVDLGNFPGLREVGTADVNAMDTDDDLEDLYYTPSAPQPSVPPPRGGSVTPTRAEPGADRLCPQWIRDRRQGLWTTTSRGTNAPRRRGKVHARTSVGGDSFVFALQDWVRTHI